MRDNMSCVGMAIYVILYLLFPFQTAFFGLLLFNDLPALIALIIPLFQTGKDTHVNHSPYRIKETLCRPLIFSSIRIRSSMPIAIFSDRSLGRFLFSVRISFACAGT